MKLTVREISVLGLLLGFMEAGKRMLDLVPNVEVITLLFILYALYLGKKAYIIAIAFTLLETSVWGVHTWVIMYLYVWPLLITLAIAHHRRKMRGVKTAPGGEYGIIQSEHGAFCILAAAFGLFFGAMCTIPYFFIGGPSMAFTWWIAGIPYDILHCVSNFLICLLLFRPLNYLFHRARTAGYL